RDVRQRRSSGQRATAISPSSSSCESSVRSSSRSTASRHVRSPRPPGTGRCPDGSTRTIPTCFALCRRRWCRQSPASVVATEAAAAAEAATVMMVMIAAAVYRRLTVLKRKKTEAYRRKRGRVQQRDRTSRSSAAAATMIAAAAIISRRRATTKKTMTTAVSSALATRARIPMASTAAVAETSKTVLLRVGVASGDDGDEGGWANKSLAPADSAHSNRHHGPQGFDGRG
ncbi:unnamed protein product, partial [Ectocarpus sp. 4 AP-2014]